MNHIRIYKEDVATITDLFRTFDEVYATSMSGSSDGYNAKLNCELPFFGHITISFSTRERHFMVYPADAEPNENNWYSGHLDHKKWVSRADLICTVQETLKQLVAESQDQRLTPA
jgi:hypothetical protein